MALAGQLSEGRMQCSIFTSVAVQWQSLVYQPPPLIDDGRVILYLHGESGFGTGIEGLFEHPDLPSLLRDGLALPASVVIPSCPVSGYWQPLTLNTFLDEFELQFARSRSRYDVLGYSRGGTGAIEFAAAYPHRVRTLATLAARVPARFVASGGSFPVLLVHGSADTRVTTAQTTTLLAGFTAAGHPCEVLTTSDDHYLVAAPLLQRVFAWQQRW
jgi:fermentation-respiration switch protein FrsA (DUF1100 family)